MTHKPGDTVTVRDPASAYAGRTAKVRCIYRVGAVIVLTVGIANPGGEVVFAVRSDMAPIAAA